MSAACDGYDQVLAGYEATAFAYGQTGASAAQRAPLRQPPFKQARQLTAHPVVTRSDVGLCIGCSLRIVELHLHRGDVWAYVKAIVVAR